MAGARRAAVAIHPAGRRPTIRSLPAGPIRPPTRSPRPAGSAGAVFDPFGDDDDAADRQPVRSASARAPPGRPRRCPRKLGLLGRGLGVFGSYAKVALLDDEPVAYAQFGPLSAYPRAQRLRELYPQLPDAPLPAVITCIATTTAGRGAGHAARLVAAICDDLAERGFAAVEAFPERGTRPDSTSAATPEFWLAAGFVLAVEDERFPVVRRELA